MGEIRSTLDIIMEKAKGLSVSEEEKKAFKTQEMAGKIKGLIRKFLDDVLDMDRLKVEVEALAERDQDMVRRMILEESIPLIRLGEDNESILKTLEGTTGMHTAPLREILKDFEDRLEQEQAVREYELKQELENRGITGTAVIPNIQADPDWGQYVSEMRERLQVQLGLYTAKPSD